MMKIRKLGCFLHMANVTPSFFGEVGVTLAMVKYQFLLMTMITDGSHIGYNFEIWAPKTGLDLWITKYGQIS